ncbi:MAG: NAD-dependent epimerase [Ramlibacter sp.]|uniref:GntR family transcriptional regulator n=1 Tax=Ramlibacter sp. TaxID=1917967 RepID=UPI0026099593|nr:GntR family transcriptional regulator [Ramlibacter sp.]MDB5751028.1 NAD-dependent epimerase [Ramlibacter sp.]
MLRSPPHGPKPPLTGDTPLVTERLSDRLAVRLGAQIESGALGPGERLPTEQQLASAHGVSRTVVREAMHQLKSRALVVARQGFGVFVASGPVNQPLAFDPSVLDSVQALVHVIEVRRVLEGEIAALAAERASRAQIAEMRRSLKAIDAAVAQGRGGVAEDLAFHRAIGDSADNPQSPPPDLLADPRVEPRIGTLLWPTDALRTEAFEGVFHLASAVSGECEADFDLGLRSNLDSTRALLDALRANASAGGKRTRLVFSSSVAVFGPDPAVPLPKLVGDATLAAPQTSYGTQKLIWGHLVADYTRKGFIDGRAARLMTVAVRPGRPNGAASSFFSGIIREPLAGAESVCPVGPDVSHPVSSPSHTVDGLIAGYEASREQFLGRTAMNLPALNVRVRDMLDGLEQVAGPATRKLVRFERDERIAGIGANWPGGAGAARAARLRLQPHENFAQIVQQYIADCRALPTAAQTLKGLQ